MNVLIIGASGKTGSLLVRESLAHGHQVTAFVRHPEKIEAAPNLRVAQGDITDSASLNAAMQGQDAVLSSLGAAHAYDDTSINTDAAHNIVQAMDKAGVKRFIAVSVLGAGDSKGHGGFLYDEILARTFLKNAIRDKNGLERETKSSDLDWTLVRPPMLGEGEATGHIQTLAEGEAGVAHKITRADLAAFMVQELENARWVRQAVVVANS